MDDQTRELLLRVSAEFYASVAESFDGTRQGGWDSWSRILSLITQDRLPQSVLDIGCGNGRFAAFLASAGSLPKRYLGVDSAAALVRKAAERYPEQVFAVGTVDDATSTDDCFDLVVGFGVFHHLPGAAYRERVLREAADRVLPGGTLALSLWQPRLLHNFDQKLCSPHAIAGLRMADLDEDDLLLSWQGNCAAPRYCHHFSDDEVNRLIAASPLPLKEAFQGSGNDRTNRYLVFGS